MLIDNLQSQGGIASSLSADAYQFLSVRPPNRNGRVRKLTYDVLGRVVSDAVTTLGAGVDGAVRRVETAYDGQGNGVKVTSYNAASGGTVVNEVFRDYNGLGQLITEWQSHAGAVVTATTPKVQYAYNFNTGGTANQSRQTTLTYPSGYAVTSNYSSGLNNAISRLSSISDTGGTLESYDYLGLGTVVRRAHPLPGVDLTYIKQGAEPTGDAGDQYTGLDRFGRVVDQRWLKTSTGTAVDRFQYGYDENSNRLFRDNLTNLASGELYGYDTLDQVASFQRGTLNGTRTGLTGAATRSQSWDYDALGNWDGVTTNGTTQARTANAQNEITSIGGATTPTYDANGNMTGDETGRQFVYDAWNRLVTVKDSGGTTLETFGYDGLSRRVTRTAGGTTTDLYYSADWQVLEEKVGANTAARYVWSPVYVDALVLRDRDTDANGTLDERLWVAQDANFNVTALIDGIGNVVERYAYDPFGVQTMYDASYAVRGGGSSYAWVYGFQGLRYDATSGLNEARFRWYSPTLGRWVSLDPIRFAAGDMNLYGFVENRPTNLVDPMGLQPPEGETGNTSDSVPFFDWFSNPRGAGAESALSRYWFGTTERFDFSLERFTRDVLRGQPFAILPQLRSAEYRDRTRWLSSDPATSAKWWSMTYDRTWTYGKPGESGRLQVEHCEKPDGTTDATATPATTFRFLLEATNGKLSAFSLSAKPEFLGRNFGVEAGWTPQEGFHAALTGTSRLGYRWLVGLDRSGLVTGTAQKVGPLEVYSGLSTPFGGKTTGTLGAAYTTERVLPFFGKRSITVFGGFGSVPSPALRTLLGTQPGEAFDSANPAHQRGIFHFGGGFR
jgi:RHS repeat-associated protein